MVRHVYIATVEVENVVNKSMSYQKSNTNRQHDICTSKKGHSI